MRLKSLAVLSVYLFSMVAICIGQSDSGKSLLEGRALQEYKSGQNAAAEKDCREIVKQNPSNILAQIYLG
jgi:predicted Zn-dependent protease